jgi:hypothetical protein
MDEKILFVARAIARIQSEWDAADHDTTTVSFMQEHGAGWLDQRNAIMGKIDERRTGAIWAIDHLISKSGPHRVAR